MGKLRTEIICTEMMKFHDQLDIQLPPKPVAYHVLFSQGSFCRLTHAARIRSEIRRAGMWGVGQDGPLHPTRAILEDRTDL
jgi:hypothetical protein